MDAKQAFENMPAAKAVLVNAVPAILSILVTLVYNVADTFFIGQTEDEMQVAAVSLTTPVFLLFMAIGTLFGIGGTSVISRAFPSARYCVYSMPAIVLSTIPFERSGSSLAGGRYPFSTVGCLSVHTN